MFSETTCKVLGFISSVIIGSYIFRIILNYNSYHKTSIPNIIEGLSSKDEDEDHEEMTQEEIDEFKDFINRLKKTSEKAKNTIKLNSPGMREMHEDMLRYMDTFVGAKIQENIMWLSWAASQKGNKVGGFQEAGVVELVKKINMMSEFQKSINRNLTDWLDNQDSGKSESNNSSSMW
tara:strand:+ start:2172 stop:2702 length:531 start_codon:yes stop_codon:yes gene_type:complete